MTDQPQYAASAGPESRPISTNVLATTAGNGNAAATDGNLNTGARTSVADPAYGPVSIRVGGDLFLLVTFVLSVIAWIVMFISQTYVAAKISNELRILWFGFVIQTILTLVVLGVIIGSSTYDAAYAYGMQVAILSSLACVFAVMGVDRTIYMRQAALRATGAGWLILSIVDLLWVLYFTSPPQSPVARLVNALVDTRGPKREEEETYGKVEKIGRSTDAFPMSTLHGGSAQRVTSSEVQTIVQQDGGAQTRGNLWNGQRTTVASAQSAGSGAGPAATEDGSERRTSTNKPPEPEITWRARALFDYAGSKDDPNELPFKKGDVLIVTDKSGKWWDAETQDGRKGIAPSNYLSLL